MSSISYVLLTALAIALLIAAFTDIRRRQIDNWLNAGIALGAPAFWWASGMALWPDLAWQLLFAVIASAVLIGIAFIGYKINVVILGGGDVKLLGALALWFTPFAYMQMLLVMGVIGGVMAVGFVVPAWISPAPPSQRSKENKMDLTIEEYLEFVRHLLEQAEEDKFFLGE